MGYIILVGMGIWIALVFVLGVGLIIWPGDPPLWYSDVGLGVTIAGPLFLLVSLVVSAVLSTLESFRDLGKRHDEYIKDLEEKGLLAAETFRATRAFQVEEFEDEGSHYFIELEDGAVLYLNGQYLYDYEEFDDECAPELNQPRQFPCTEFTRRRHKEDGYAVDILCRGTVFEPEGMASGFDWEAFIGARVPEDGEIFRDRSYDEIKAFAKQIKELDDE